jgi:hypothetical protein
VQRHVVDDRPLTGRQVLDEGLIAEQQQAEFAQPGDVPPGLLGRLAGELGDGGHRLA